MLKISHLLFAFLTRALHGDAKGNYWHFRVSCLTELSQVVSPVRVKQSYLQ